MGKHRGSKSEWGAPPGWVQGEPLQRLFEQAGPTFVAGAWRAQGGDAASLAQALGCDEETALYVGLCLAPWPGCDLHFWSRKLAARFGLARDRVWLVGWSMSEAESVERCDGASTAETSDEEKVR